MIIMAQAISTRNISALRSLLFKQSSITYLTPIFSINRVLQLRTQAHKPKRKPARAGDPPHHNDKPPSADSQAMNIQQGVAAPVNRASGAGIKRNQEKFTGLEKEATCD